MATSCSLPPGVRKFKSFRPERLLLPGMMEPLDGLFNGGGSSASCASLWTGLRGQSSLLLLRSALRASSRSRVVGSLDRTPSFVRLKPDFVHRIMKISRLTVWTGFPVFFWRATLLQISCDIASVRSRRQVSDLDASANSGPRVRRGS